MPTQETTAGVECLLFDGCFSNYINEGIIQRLLVETIDMYDLSIGFFAEV